MPFEWLPPLVLLEESNGSWEHYVERIYGYFRADFIEGRPTYGAIRLGLRRHPVVQGKETTFWHLISDGETEDERIPDMRRCERIRWVRAVIEGANNRADVVVWKQNRNGKTNVAIALNDFSYIVFLGERQGDSGPYVIPLTAYWVEREHKRNKYQREYQAYLEAEAAKAGGS